MICPFTLLLGLFLQRRKERPKELAPLGVATPVFFQKARVSGSGAPEGEPDLPLRQTIMVEGQSLEDHRCQPVFRRLVPFGSPQHPCPGRNMGGAERFYQKRISVAEVMRQSAGCHTGN